MKRSRAASFGWRSFGRRAPPLLPFVHGGGASAARETSLLNPDLADARLLFSTLDPLDIGVVAPRLFQEEPPERHPHGGHRRPPLPGIWEGVLHRASGKAPSTSCTRGMESSTATKVNPSSSSMSRAVAVAQHR